MVGDGGVRGRIAGVRRVNYDWREVGVLWVGDVPISESKCVLGSDGGACTSTPSVRVGWAVEKSKPVVIDELYRLVSFQGCDTTRDVISWAFG